MRSTILKIRQVVVASAETLVWIGGVAGGFGVLISLKGKIVGSEFFFTVAQNFSSNPDALITNTLKICGCVSGAVLAVHGYFKIREQRILVGKARGNVLRILVPTVSIFCTVGVAGFLGAAITAPKMPVDILDDCIFQQASRRGWVFARGYAANAQTTYNFVIGESAIGPNCYVKLRMKPYDRFLQNHAGWILLLDPAWSLEDFDVLSFRVWGQAANHVGIKFRDVHGTEVDRLLTNYDEKQRFDDHWRTVDIPLEDFGNVDFGSIEVLGFFTNGTLGGPTPKNVGLGAFKLRRNKKTNKLIHQLFSK